MSHVSINLQCLVDRALIFVRAISVEAVVERVAEFTHMVVRHMNLWSTIITRGTIKA